MTIGATKNKESLLKAGFNEKQVEALTPVYDLLSRQKDYVDSQAITKTDLKWWISTFMALIGILIGLVVISITIVQINASALNQRIDDTNQRIDDTNQRVDRVESSIVELRTLILKVLENQNRNK